MLSKNDLLNLGYEINPDPDQPGMFYWKNDTEGSDISFDSEAGAMTDAENDARGTYDLHRCDNCGKIHSDETLKIAKHLSERVDAGGVMPSGECSDCGALCYPLEDDPDWETVMNYFGLDNSFVWTAAHVQDYTRQYIEAIAGEGLQAESGKRAIALLEEAEAYLRDIRAENLDGSEPALGELLERITGFWIESGTEPDPGDVAEWVGLHYKVNFDAEPANRKADWIERFKELVAP